MFRFLVPGIAVTLLTTSCGSVSPSSQLKGLAHSANGKNAAVIFGSPNGLPGVPTDVAEFGNLLRSETYSLHIPRIETNARATVKQILETSAKLAAESDTLIWYFSGHGNTGILQATDRSFRFKDVSDAIIAARGGKPLDRLLVFIDSCYSGSFVDGSAPIIPSNSQKDLTGVTISTKCAKLTDREASTESAKDVFADFAAAQGDLYSEAFVITSSTKSQTSIDMGREKGGAFTWAIRGVVKNLSEKNQSATIKDFAESTRTETQKIGRHTPVYRGFPSDTMMNETFFEYAH